LEKRFRKTVHLFERLYPGGRRGKAGGGFEDKSFLPLRGFIHQFRSEMPGARRNMIEGEEKLR